MRARESNVGDDASAKHFNRMMNQDNFKSLPFNTILHKFNSKKIQSASDEALSKKTSWKSRNFLKIKINDSGGRVYNESEVPPAIRYLTSQEIKTKNTESAYNPIKFEGNQFAMPTRYRRRPNADANHTITIDDRKYRDSKAMADYNREVSKRLRVLKNNPNRYFARYEFDNKLKDNEQKRNQSIEDSYKNKLSFVREKELKRGYDILSLESHFKEPRRERKINYVQEIFPNKDRTSIDGYKPSVKPTVWDQINRTDDKRSALRSSLIGELRTSHSMIKNERLVSKRSSHQNNIRSSASIRSNLEASNRYDRLNRGSKQQIKETFEASNHYSNGGFRNSKNLSRHPLSRSLNTIGIPNIAS